MTRSRTPILLVEDTRSLSMVYEATLRKAGHDVTCAYLAEEARYAHAGAKGQVVLLDLMLPDGDGLDLLKEMSAADPAGKIIVITANGSINRAVDAMRNGAFDFLVKPFDERRLLVAVENALATVDADKGAARPASMHPDAGFHGFVGNAPEMREIYRLISEIGRSTATVFITGESGTGKEVAAEAIHRESTRANKPFIALNCGAIPRDLLESEVFGHLRGSFTGAISDKQGAAAAADGGTLFLDEICEMDLALQTKLLRFLQTSTVTPVGATAPRKVDARIVCATNRNPVEEVRAGRFREDLFYRLHVVPIHLPALRDRGSDIVTVAETFLSRFARREGKKFLRLSDEVKECLSRLPWPGNVRQLQNVIWNTVLLHDAETVEMSMLPAGLHHGATMQAALPAEFAPLPVSPVPRDTSVSGALSELVQPLVGSTMAEIERQVIEATIAAVDGSVPQAARMLDLSPSTIYRKLDAWAKQGPR